MKANRKRPFAGKTVVVTGASAGVGRAAAEAFGREGAKVALIARQAERLEQAKADVLAAGAPAALAITADVSDAPAMEAAADQAENQLGPIDVWVNNAMVSVLSPVKQMRAEEFKRVTEVTYLGVVYGTLAALKRMLPRDEGVIVQVGSALAYRGLPLQAAYSAAKHAIQGFHDSLRAELLHDKSHVRVSMVQLPALNTPQFEWIKSRLPQQPQPVPPIFQPEVAARAILWAAGHDRKEVVVGGSSQLALWLNKLAPALADRYLSKTGYRSQQTDEPKDPARPDNLWRPAPQLYGAHGRFDARAKTASAQLWLTTHRRWLAGLGVLALSGLIAARAKKRLAG
ncbi:SDR family oxidoreductase [Candidatus Parcubacteria bacterium]|nr:SDR family oxidoreductase [Candidatus Parcubacteria bacterium]